MGIRLRLSSLAILLAVATGIASSQGTGASSQKQALWLDVSAVQEIVKSGSPVKVKATLTNKSNQDIPLFFLSGEDGGGSFTVDVRRDEDGKLARETRLGNVRNGHADPLTMTPGETNRSGVWFDLKPAKPLTIEVNISKLYDLISPGKYVVRIEAYDPGTNQEVKSNPLTVTVTP
jgi:hypothetical protein